MIGRLLVLLALCSEACALNFGRPIIRLNRLRGGSPSMSGGEIAIVVDAEIEPDRVEEFLKVIEEDTIGSRKEPGCLCTTSARPQHLAVPA